MFVGWEGVGLCSYLLIGFYFLKNPLPTPAKKLHRHRIGDAVSSRHSLTAVTLGTIRFTTQGLPIPGLLRIFQALNASVESHALALGAPC